jgi:hypothetical protein
VNMGLSISDLTTCSSLTIIEAEEVMPKLKPSAPKKAKQKRVKDELHKSKEGTLHSGSKKGPMVTDRKQAIAIALSEAGFSKKDKTRTAKK